MTRLQRPLPVPGGLVISPRGDKVAYHLRTRVSPHERPPRYTASIWVADVGQARSTRQVTHSPFDDYAPQWSADGAYILFMSDRHPREHACDNRIKYHLYRLWFRVDTQPAPVIVHWTFTQFCTWQHGKFLLIEQNGSGHFEQRFIDGHRLRPQRFNDCAVYGHGHVAMLAPCTVPSDGRVAMLVAQWSRSATNPPHPAPATRKQSLLWMGGHCQPYAVAVSKTHQPRDPQDPLFPFYISHIAWAGRTLFFLSNDSCEENGDSVPLRPAIYRMGGEPEEDKDRDETYSRVCGGGDDDGSQILSIGGAGDDLLVHERDAAGDETLHLLHSGRTLWKQKEGIVEAVATKAQNNNGPVFIAMISSPVGDDQPGEVFSIVVAADATSPGQRVQLSNHGSVAALIN